MGHCRLKIFDLLLLCLRVSWDTFLFMDRVVLFYKTESGACPVERFLRKQSMTVREAVASAFEHIERNSHTPSLFQKMVNTDDLWEIRIKKIGNIFRLLCFFDGSRVVVVASAFQKKTQKTPLQEIRTATQRKRLYFGRNDNE